MSDRRVIREVVPLPLGHPDRPLTVEGAISKFKRNVGSSERDSVVGRSDELVDRIMNLELESNVCAVIGAFAKDGRTE
jgi:hypothetical protein